jgi:uncharacterized repeat protein (TIGR03803 family)
MMAILAVLAAALAGVPSAWAATETVLYSFQGGTDGAYLNGGVIEVNGKLYGTTMYGGAYDQGIVFELRRTKAGWVKKTLHDFTFYGSDGGEPRAGLVADKSGNLYGTAFAKLSGGVVFELSLGRENGWRYRVIHTFTGDEGYNPFGGLVVDDAGNLYGTTANGGPNSCNAYDNCGNVFKLSPSKHGWTVTTLHDFDGSDGAQPMSTLYRDSKGNLYGNTVAGGVGSECGNNACGVVFELSPSGNGWNFADIYAFNSPPQGLTRTAR